MSAETEAIRALAGLEPLRSADTNAPSVAVVAKAAIAITHGLLAVAEAIDELTTNQGMRG